MTNSSFKEGVQFAWDSTSMTAAATCPRKYYYSLCLGISPKIKSVHLIFGGHYASALEFFYKVRAWGQDYETALRNTVHKTLKDTWDTKTKAPQDMGIHNAKTRHGLIRSVIWYLEQYAKKETGMLTHHMADGTPCVETSFSIDLNNELIICGHLDRIVDYNTDLYIMDQKTTGSALGSYYFDQFKPDIQMSTYTWAGQAILETPVKGVIIDAAQISVGGTSFARGFTHRTKEELEEHINSMYEIIRRIQLYTEESLHRDRPESAFPMNPSACGNYGGCAFRKICSSSPRIRKAVINTDFEPKSWDPLERR